MSFAHFFVKSLEGRLEHADGFFEVVLCLLDVVFDENASHDFPAFSFTFERLQIIEDEVVLSALFFHLDVSFENFCVLGLDLVIVLSDFLSG